MNLSKNFYSVAYNFLDGGKAPPLVRQIERLENVRERRVEARDTLYGRLKMQETLLLQKTSFINIKSLNFMKILSYGLRVNVDSISLMDKKISYM